MNSFDRMLCQVRLADAHGGLHGCGVICGPRHVLTCSHVVAACLGGVAAGDVVNARFGGDPDHLAQLVVSRCYAETPAPQATPAEKLRRDICLLELAPGAAFPVAFTIATPFDDEVEDELPFTALGLGAFDGPGGLRVLTVDLKGLTGNYAEASRLFVHGPGGGVDDQVIRPGCSGAAAFNGYRGMIGLIVEEQQARAGFLIPIDVLRQVWDFDLGAPALAATAASRAATPTAADPLNQRVLAELDHFDREQQVVQFARAFDANWKAQRRGFVCAIAGLDDDRPQQCRDRLRNHLRPFFERQGFKAAKIFAYEIGWPAEERFDVADRLAEMAGKLQLHAGADEMDAGLIRDGLNERLAPSIFYSVVDQRRWGRRHVQLLQGWSGLLARISEGRLDKPLIHFLILRLDDAQLDADTASPGARLDRFYRELDAEVNRGAVTRRLERTDRLRDFDRDFVENWVDQLGAKLALDDRTVAGMRRSVGDFIPGRASFRLERVEKWIKQLA